MRAATAALFFISASLGAAQGPQADPYEAIHQAEYLLADLLDTKQYDRLHEALTDDVVYDSRPLGSYGGLSVGLEELTNNVRAAFGDAYNQHHVGNALIKFVNDEATSANVTTYLTWSRWDAAAPNDITKTFRLYEKCDDLFVLDPSDGRWKLKYSLVTLMAPKVEGVYWNDASQTCN